MDKEIAKAFLFDASLGEDNCKTLYMSKDLQRLLDMSLGDLHFIYAIIDTESGETLMIMDWSYSNEPIIMRRFIHLEYFLEYHWDYKVVNLDKITK